MTLSATMSETRYIEQSLTTLERQIAQLSVMMANLEVLLQPIKHNEARPEEAARREEIEHAHA